MLKEKFTNINIHFVKRFSHRALQDILVLEKECFPKAWQYDDAESHYRERLKDKANISLFLKDGGKTVGYILGVPCNKSFPELTEFDPMLKDNEKCCYIETIQILPENRGNGGARILLNALCNEARRRGVISFSIHARTINRFNENIKIIFEGHIKEIRKIKSWSPACGESYEYIAWDF